MGVGAKLLRHCINAWATRKGSGAWIEHFVGSPKIWRYHRAFSWSFADKERRTPYILRRHCINACYSCSAFVGLHPPLSVLPSFFSYSYLFLMPFCILFLFLSFSLPLSFSLSFSLRFGCTPASYISTDVQFISYVTSSIPTYTYAVVRKLEYRPFHLQASGQTTTCT